MGNRLEGRVAVVTGAGRGIGREIALMFASEGARVVVNDLGGGADGTGSSTSPAEDVAAEIRSAGGEAVVNGEDVSQWDGAERMIRQAIDTYGRLDVLVNNAGIAQHDLEDTWNSSEETWDRILRVNLKSVFLCCKFAIPQLIERGGGAIVNVASIEALAGMNSVAAYTSTKWALRGFTKSSAIELGQDGIRVNCVCPSGGNPDISKPFLDQVDVKRYMQHLPPPILYDGEHPLRVSMEDIASVIVFLLSPDSRGCTGGEFAVDAGWTAGRRLKYQPGYSVE